MGVVNHDPGELTAYIFTTRIRQAAAAKNVKFKHMVLYVQMHEYVYVLQWVTIKPIVTASALRRRMSSSIWKRKDITP